MKKIKLILLSIFNLFLIQSAFAQNQKIADSLILELRKIDTGNDSLRFNILHQISFNHNNPDSAFYYARVLETEALKVNNQKNLQMAYFDIGTALRLKGDLYESIEAYFKGAEIAKILGDSTKLANAYSGIADVYSESGASENSILYYQQAISILRITNDSIRLASTLLNAGDEFFYASQPDSALIYFEESGDIFNLKNYSIGKAYSLGNVGMLYAEQGKDVLAEQNINEAIAILEDIKDYYPISVYLTYMSDIYLRKNNDARALNYAQRSLDLAQKYGLKDQISDASLKLFKLNQQKGNFEDAIDNLQNYYTYRDSVLNIKAVEEMANLRTNYEVSQKQAEIELKEVELGLLNAKQRNQRITVIATIVALVLIAMLAVGLFRRNRFIQKTSNIIQKERDRSDNLLRNILPQDTAQELKEKGKVEAKRFESVSVMFTDFKGFTAYSANLSPEELVESVNYYYSKFDEIMEKYGLEKIKTVGDAYMAAGGLPFPTSDHALKMVEAAFEIAEFVRESKKFDPDDMTRFDIRIGLNTGPVVAGVVGTKKFAYDIWGDTVNIASRMESNSEPGKINVSENTYQLIKDQYKCTYRGEIEAKNKGKLNMYFVEKKIL